MKKKRQHVIPNCYLKAWCDPRTPPGQHPFIWLISKDGGQRRKKSPKKSFVDTDRYTIKLPGGQRDLVIENTLADIENRFVEILKRIRRRENLNIRDRARLCIFVAAMQSRTKAFGEHWKNQLRKVHEQVLALEKAHHAEPTTSKEIAQLVEHSQQYMIASSLDIMARLLFLMPLTVLVTDDEVGFITSDAPCVLFNPNWHKFPPLYRSPGLGQKDIEVTLPLTPQQLLLISHQPYPLYQVVPQADVDELNRRTRFHCAGEFVSWKGDTRPYWFERGKEPEDSWEKSEEGRQALADSERRRAG